MLDTIRRFLFAWGALVAGVLFATLDVAQVAGISAWGYLAYLFLALFIGVLFHENYNLRSGSETINRFIVDLTHLATEGAGLKEHQGAGAYFLSIGPSTPADLDRERVFREHKRQFEALRVEWGQKVRAKLDAGPPGYVAEWEACKLDARFDLLQQIIRELRGRYKP